MYIRKNFQAIYLAKNIDEFKQLLQKWYLWSTKSRLKPIINEGKTIKNHWEGNYQMGR